MRGIGRVRRHEYAHGLVLLSYLAAVLVTFPADDVRPGTAADSATKGMMSIWHLKGYTAADTDSSLL